LRLPIPSESGGGHQSLHWPPFPVGAGRPAPTVNVFTKLSG
jgi:hypothetical protein